jgi:hypothetical protein
MRSFTTIAYLSSNIIRMIKFKRIRQEGQATRMGQIEMYTKFCSDTLNGRKNFVLSKSILAWILENQGGKAWNGLKRVRLAASC